MKILVLFAIVASASIAKADGKTRLFLTAQKKLVGFEQKNRLYDDHLMGKLASSSDHSRKIITKRLASNHVKMKTVIIDESFEKGHVRITAEKQKIARDEFTVIRIEGTNIDKEFFNGLKLDLDSLKHLVNNIRFVKYGDKDFLELSNIVNGQKVQTIEMKLSTAQSEYVHDRQFKLLGRTLDANLEKLASSHSIKPQLTRQAVAMEATK